MIELYLSEDEIYAILRLMELAESDRYLNLGEDEMSAKQKLNKAVDRYRKNIEHMKHVQDVMDKCRATGLTPFQLLHTPFYTDKFKP